jgi:DNA-directed RNA polymerase subunit L
MGAENKPHIEIHLTIAAKEEEKPREMLEKAMRELAKLVEENGGKVTDKN